MARFLAISVLMICLTSALGLKCYLCSSMKSEEDCVKQQQLVTCAPGQDRCQTLYTTFNNGSIVSKHFVKQCLSGETCDTTSTVVSVLCKDPDWTCSHSCCGQDACNEMEGASEAPVPTPRPLQCYHCSSNKSWDDCDDVREVVSCPDDEDQSCAKLGLHGERDGQTIQGYFRRCFDTSLCEDDNDCKFESDDQSLTITKCDFSCCTDDLCNEAIAVPVVSVIILLACALQAVFI